MRTTAGWVWWGQWADPQSIARWEDDGGSYDPWTGDLLERADIIRAGFNRWFDSWIIQHYGSPAKVGGYIYGWWMSVTYSAAYEAGLRGDPTWPRRPNTDKNPLTQQRLHDAFMVGVTDEETRAELAKLGYLP